MPPIDVNPTSSETTFTPDRLQAGGPIKTEIVTVLTGNVLARGDVLGRITASGKWIKSLSAAVDGSQVPRGIAAVAVDASAGDKANAVIYVAGEFNADEISLGTAHTLASVRNDLALAGIFLQDPVDA